MQAILHPDGAVNVAPIWPWWRSTCALIDLKKERHDGSQSVVPSNLFTPKKATNPARGRSSDLLDITPLSPRRNPER